MINSSFEGWDTVLLDTVAYTQFLAYGHSCTPGYVVWVCGKDPQYTLTEKVQAITALQSSLRGITEYCCKIASLVAKRMLIKKSSVCPGHLIWPFLKVRLSSGSADWSLIWNAWDRKDLGKDYNSNKTHSSSLTCLVNSLTAFTCLPWKFVRVWPLCPSISEHLSANSIRTERRVTPDIEAAGRQASLGRPSRNSDEQRCSFPHWLLGNVKSTGKKITEGLKLYKMLPCLNVPK